MIGMLRRLSKLLWKIFQQHQKLHTYIYIYTHLYFHLHTIIAVSVGDADNSSFPAGSQARCVTGQWPCCWSTCTELVDGLQFTTQACHTISPFLFFTNNRIMLVIKSNIKHKQQSTHSKCKLLCLWGKDQLSVNQAKNWSLVLFYIIICNGRWWCKIKNKKNRKYVWCRC